jgi:glycosyltransferase involved in cell wall biosynthesis
MLSAFVVTYNRPHILEACLKAARFVDELIVVDKADSLENFAAAHAGLADRITVALWSPTVEQTRDYALSLCTGDWILSLDDDEILSPACGEAFRAAIAGDQADVWTVPMRHYVLGRHDERAAYWPEFRPCLFRRGSVTFRPTVHRGVDVAPDARQKCFKPGGPVYIDHLSHESVSVWIEKTNRYTDQKDRVGTHPSGSLIDWAINAMVVRCARARAFGRDANGDYLEAVAVLKGIYDIVDGLKRWEAATQPDGDEAFREVCAEVMAR